MHPTGTNVTIFSEALEGVTLEEYVAVVLDEFGRGLTGQGVGEFEETSRTRINDPAGLLIRGRTSPTPDAPVLVVTILIAIHGQRSVVNAFVRESLSELHQPILEAMLGSLKLFTPSPPPADDHGDSPGTATHIILISQNGGATGFIEAPVDVDYFSFRVIAGLTYEAEVHLETLDDALLTLYSDGGTCRVTASVDHDNTGAPLIRWRADNGDTSNGLTFVSYYLSVENAAGISTGIYALLLKFKRAAPTDDHGNEFCSATAISVGDEVTGIIEEPIDVDSFSFPAEAGKTYRIIVSLGTLGDSLLWLWDTDGATLLEVNDDFGTTLASRIEWTAPESGTYFVDVENADLVSTGTYTLTITTVP